MRVKYTIKNSITSFISNIINFIFLFIGQTILIKILGIEYTGLNGLFSNVLTILNLLELGIGNAIIYNLYKYIKKDDKNTIKSIVNFYKKSYNIVSIVILVIGILIIPFLKYIVKDINIDINIYIVYILFLLNTISTYFLAYKRNLLFSYQKDYIINTIHMICIIMLNITQILIIYITKNYYLYLILKIIFNLLENIIINIKTNKEYPFIKDKNILKLDKNIKEDIINRVKALFIHKTSSAVTNGTDNILISMFFGLKSVALCTNYFYILNTIKMFSSNIITSTSASVGNLLTEKNKDKNYEVFKKILFLNYWISIFTSISLLVLINPFIKLWLGKDFILSNLVLFALVINYFQTMMRNTFSIFKDSAGIWVEDKYIPIFQIIINITSSVILSKIFSLSGIFMGTIISSFVLWLYSYPKFVYKGLLNKRYISYAINIIKKILLFTFILLITYYASNYIKVDNILLELVLKLLLCTVLPNTILIIIYKNNNEFNYYKNMILKK